MGEIHIAKFFPWEHIPIPTVWGVAGVQAESHSLIFLEVSNYVLKSPKWV